MGMVVSVQCSVGFGLWALGFGVRKRTLGVRRGTVFSYSLFAIYELPITKPRDG